MGSTWTSTLPVRWSVSTSATPQKLVDLFHARVGSAPGSSTLPPESPTHPAEQYARRPAAALKPKSYVGLVELSVTLAIRLHVAISRPGRLSRPPRFPPARRSG